MSTSPDSVPASASDAVPDSALGRDVRQVRLDRERCRGCLLCLDICPNDLFVRDTQLNASGALPAAMRFGEYCINCMRCVTICPDKAFIVPEKPDFNLPGYVFGLSLRWHRLTTPTAPEETRP